MATVLHAIYLGLLHLRYGANKRTAGTGEMTLVLQAVFPIAIPKRMNLYGIVLQILRQRLFE